MSEWCCAVQDVAVRFGMTRALEAVSFTIPAQSCMFLLGPNGSGKSTLLRVISGLLTPTEGNRVMSKSAPWTTSFGSQRSFLYRDLTVIENLRLFQRIVARRLQTRPLPDLDLATLLSEWDLSGVAQKLVRHLSNGTIARVTLCRVFLESPDLLLLDEPSSFLDDRAVELLISSIKRFLASSTQRAVVIATHDLHRLLSLATHAVLLEGGRITMNRDEGDIEALISHYRTDNR